METKEEKINPEDIVFTSEEDAEMPAPETEDYDKKEEDATNKRILKPTFKFIELFEQCMGKLPYATVLKNSNNNQIKLVDLMKFVEVKHDKMTVGEMNTVIGFVASCPLEFVRPLMEIVEDTKRQPELWTLE